MGNGHGKEEEDQEEESSEEILRSCSVPGRMLHEIMSSHYDERHTSLPTNSTAVDETSSLDETFTTEGTDVWMERTGWVPPEGVLVEKAACDEGLMCMVDRTIQARHSNRVTEELWASAFAVAVAAKWLAFGINNSEDALKRFNAQLSRVRTTTSEIEMPHDLSAMGRLKHRICPFCEQQATAARKKMEATSKKFEAHLVTLHETRDILNIIATSQTDAEDHQIIKPSSSKKAKWRRLVDCVATNLMVYVASMRRRSEYSCITVGAPAAHSLGFTKGGMWRLHMELEKTKQRLDKHLADPRNNPDAVDGTEFALTVSIEILRLQLNQRLDLCLPQAMGAALAAIWDALPKLCAEAHFEQLESCGMLLQVSSLLSTQGKETGMLEDFIYTLHVLGKCQIGFLPSTTSGVAPPRDTRDVASSMLWFDPRSVVLRLPSEETWAARLLQSFPPGKWMRVVPVLFSLGVNEMQTVANTFGSTSVEKEINLHGVQRLQRYCRGLSQPLAEAQAEDLGQLEHLVAKGGGTKDIDILTLPAKIAHALNGAHWISCKSAKDRTSMLCTLEASQTLLPAWQLGWNSPLIEDTHMDCANELRSQNGVRLNNCASNTGKRAYAFNKLQWQALPKQLRPPLNSSHCV